MSSQTDRLSHSCQRFAAHEVSMAPGQQTLRLVRETPPQQLGNDESEHSITQEFKTIVTASCWLGTPTVATL